MSALATFFLGSPALLAALAGILGALGWGFHQRLAGARAERARQAASEARARDIADEVDNDVGVLPADAARKELKSWAKD